MLKGGAATWTAIHPVAPRDPGRITTGIPVILDPVTVGAMPIMDVVEVATWTAIHPVAPRGPGRTTTAIPVILDPAIDGGERGTCLDCDSSGCTRCPR